MTYSDAAPAPPGTFRVVRRMMHSLDAIPAGDLRAPELNAEGQFVIRCGLDELRDLYDDGTPRAYWQELGDDDYWMLLARVAHMLYYWVPRPHRDGLPPPYHKVGAQRRPANGLEL